MGKAKNLRRHLNEQVQADECMESGCYCYMHSEFYYSITFKYQQYKYLVTVKNRMKTMDNG